MSTSVSPRPATSAHPTRQQLDELDALLQRMLDLPVQPADELAAPRPTPAVPAKSAARDDGPPLEWYLWPFAVIDTLFGVLLYLVWPVRGFLRSPAGRSLLGGAGVLCLLAAAAWAALDWFGWTW